MLKVIILELSNGVHIVHLIETNDEEDEDDNKTLVAAVSCLNVTSKPTNKDIASERSVFLSFFFY